MTELIFDAALVTLGSGKDLTTSAEPPKSFKRPYKKSLSGCKACKARKVKCDEQRPVCSNCKKRYISLSCCEYNSKHARPSLKIPSSSTHSTSSPPDKIKLQRHVPIKPSGLDESNRVLELRLLHHYTKSTCAKHTLRDMVPILEHSMWEIDIPQMAFSCPAVLDALLGITALNLVSLQPGDQSLALASRLYFNKAIEKHRDAVSSLNADNAESSLVAAVLIAHHTWLSTHMFENTDDHYNLTLVTFRICQGIEALVRRASPWLEKYAFTPEYVAICASNDSQSVGFLTLALEDIDFLSTHFYNEGVSPQDSGAYRDAADEIVKIYYILAAPQLDICQIEQAIVTILHRTPARFLELLELEDPLAMALMARNLCHLVFVEDSKAWWIHGAGDNKVAIKAVHAISRLMPPEWLWTMVWPMNVISKEIKLDLEYSLRPPSM